MLLSRQCIAVLMLVGAISLCHGAEVVYEWNSIEFDWPSDAREAEARASGDLVPENIRLGEVREFDGTLFVGTPRTQAGGVPATLSTVVEKDGMPMLLPFPSWEVASLSIVAFEIDHKGRVYAINRTPEEDQLQIYLIKTKELLRTVPLPRRVESVAVDDHSRSYTSIRDTDASTVFMLAADESSGSTGRVVVYTHNHQRNSFREIKLPPTYDKGNTGDSRVGITVHMDHCYLSSPTQLFSMRADEAKQAHGNPGIYPVAKSPASSALQSVLYHATSRAVLFARATEKNVFKLLPMSAWSSTMEEGQVQVTKDGDVLDRVTSLSMDWTYGVIVASSRAQHAATGVNHRISLIPVMDLMEKEQKAEKEAMDFSDL